MRRYRSELFLRGRATMRPPFVLLSSNRNLVEIELFKDRPAVDGIPDGEGRCVHRTGLTVGEANKFRLRAGAGPVRQPGPIGAAAADKVGEVAGHGACHLVVPLGRVEGVRQRLAFLGRPLLPSMMVECAYILRDARNAFGALRDGLTPGTRPTALICGNDVIAVGALLGARLRGIRLPEALSITGFDNLPISGEIAPAITTIDIRAAAMGQEAAAALIRAIDSGQPVESRELPTRLILRDSTNCPVANRRLGVTPASALIRGPSRNAKGSYFRMEGIKVLEVAHDVARYAQPRPN